LGTFWSTIDNRTLLLATSFAAGVSSLLMLLIRSLRRTYPGYLHWAAGLACIAAAAFLHGMRGVVPLVLTVVVGNALLCLGMLLYVGGVRLFCGLTWRLRVSLLALLAAVTGVAWFYFARPSEVPRAVILTVYQATLAAYAAFSLWRTAPAERRLSFDLTAAAFALLAAAFFFRLLAFPWIPAQGLSLGPSAPNTLFYLAMLLGTMGVVFGFFMLTHERLLEELRAAHDSLDTETSERLSIERRLAEARQLEMVGRLAGGVAHFFNNKLCVMNGYAALLQIRRDLPADVLGMARHIEEAGLQMAAMTDRLLAFSRGKMLRSADVDLRVWLQGVEPRIRAIFPSPVHVNFEVPDEALTAYVEADELTRVVMRMAQNAREAMPRGGLFGVRLQRVEIDAAASVEAPGVPPGCYACILFADTGIGMDEDTRRRVFEPFFSTKGLAKAEGLGLGSAFGFISQSGGTITVESAPGRGTTFRIYLPLNKTAAAMEPAAQRGDRA
jgi:signal transduction histidine kinase